MIGDFTIAPVTLGVYVLVALSVGYALGLRDGRRGRWFRIVWGRRAGLGGRGKPRNTSQ